MSVAEQKATDDGAGHEVAHVPPAGPGVPPKHPLKDLACYVKGYAREKPGIAAAWCFGLGFVLGWKLRIW